MTTVNWLSNNYIEIIGALAGIIYVFLEIRQNLWLWPVGIATSAAYIWIFLSGKLYADMGLQVYYLVISILGWYWWVNKKRGRSKRSRDSVLMEEEEGATRNEATQLRDNRRERFLVTRLKLRSGIILTVIFFNLFIILWVVLENLTDSPVPVADSFITSLSIIATWMLARKIYEHWYLWIVVNITASILFLTRGLYPTVILYIVYCTMSFVGLIEWKKSIKQKET